MWVCFKQVQHLYLTSNIVKTKIYLYFSPCAGDYWGAQIDINEGILRITGSVQNDLISFYSLKAWPVMCSTLWYNSFWIKLNEYTTV